MKRRRKNDTTHMTQLNLLASDCLRGVCDYLDAVSVIMLTWCCKSMRRELCSVRSKKIWCRLVDDALKSGLVVLNVVPSPSHPKVHILQREMLSLILVQRNCSCCHVSHLASLWWEFRRRLCVHCKIANLVPSGVVSRYFLRNHHATKGLETLPKLHARATFYWRQDLQRFFDKEYSVVTQISTFIARYTNTTLQPKHIQDNLFRICGREGDLYMRLQTLLTEHNFWTRTALLPMFAAKFLKQWVETELRLAHYQKLTNKEFEYIYDLQMAHELRRPKAPIFRYPLFNCARCAGIWSYYRGSFQGVIDHTKGKHLSWPPYLHFDFHP